MVRRHFPATQPQSAPFPVHGPCTAPFTSVLRERLNNGGVFFQLSCVSWLVPTIVSGFYRPLDSENDPRVRESVSHCEGKRANRARPANYRQRTAGRCTKRLAFFPWLRETLSLERRLASLSISFLRHY